MTDNDIPLATNQPHFEEHCSLQKDESVGKIGVIGEGPIRQGNVTTFDDQIREESGAVPNNQLRGVSGTFSEKQSNENTAIPDGQITERQWAPHPTVELVMEKKKSIFDDQLPGKNKRLSEAGEENMTKPYNTIFRADSRIPDDIQCFDLNATDRKNEEFEVQEKLLHPGRTVQLDDIAMNEKIGNNQQQLHDSTNENMERELIPELLLNDILAEVHTAMKTNYGSMLLENLSIEPEALIYPIFENSFQAVVQTYQSKPETQNFDMDQVKQAVTLKSQENLSEYIDVHRRIMIFHSKIHNHITPHFDSSSGSELIEIAEEIKNHLISEESPFEELKQFLPGISEDWLKNYIQQLDFVIDSEKSDRQENIKYLLTTVNEIYVCHLETIISKSHLNTQQLEQLHSHLVKAFTEAAKFLDGEDSNIAKTISENLNAEFNNLKEKNRIKFSRLQRVVEKVLTDQKKVYCNKMEEILKTAVDLSDLTSKHEEVLKEIENNLKSEICLQIGNNEPCDNYLKTLNISIEKYWNNFQYVFNSETKKVVEVTKKVSLTPQTLAPLPPPVIINSQENSDIYKATPINFIVFHLSLSQISVALPEGDDVQHLHTTSTSLYLTPDGKLKYLGNNNLDSLPKGSKVIKIGEYLSGKHDKTTRPKVKFGNNEIEVTTELLLGFLFHTLKQNVERKKQARVQSSLIIVPFWLTSFQRQQIVDAGKVAGFDETNLINENLAIAVYANSKLADTSLDICVISENSDRVDATVYSTSKLNTGLKVLKVTGHCGDYEIKTKESREERVFQACSTAVKNHSAIKSVKGTIKKRKLLYCLSHESKEWKQRLVMVKIRLGNLGNAYEDCWKNGIILQGACVYAKYMQNYNKTVMEKISGKYFYKISSTENRKEVVALFSKKDQNQDNPKEIVTKPLPAGTKEVFFYQSEDYDDKIFQIGKLEILIDVTEKQKLQLKMYFDHNNIASFVGFNGETNPKKEETGPCQHVWTSSNLKLDQINELRSIIHRKASVLSAKSPFNTPKTSISKPNLNEELIQKFNVMASRITNGEGNFRSDVGRGMALDQITKSVENLTGSVNVSDIKSQQAFYDNLLHKYFSG